MKGRTGSTLSRTKYIKCFKVETSRYRVVLQKFIVTVEQYCTIKRKVILSNVKQDLL